jgi:hypothetical protein
VTISILSNYDSCTAAALVAGASLDLINPHNAPANYVIPHEQAIRSAILRWAYETAGVPQDSQDPVSVKTISELLDNELEELLLADRETQSC